MPLKLTARLSVSGASGVHRKRTARMSTGERTVAPRSIHRFAASAADDDDSANSKADDGDSKAADKAAELALNTAAAAKATPKIRMRLPACDR